MRRRIFIILFLVYLILFLLGFSSQALGASQVVEYLCELGVSFYRMGRYDDALTEFKKVLLLEPENKTAKEYINSIFQGETQPVISEEKVVQPITTLKEKKLPTQKIVKEIKKTPTRKEAIESTLKSLEKKQRVSERLVEKAEKEEKYVIAGIKITGETQLSLGITPQDTLWKQADGNLNEEDWRSLSDNALNRRVNTYDTRIYDRLRVNLDKESAEGLGFHTNITIDPWSFTGKSNKFTLTSGGDSAEVELYYWSNSRYTFSHTIYTREKGDSFSTGEMKVVHGRVLPTSITTVNTNIFNIPETEIERQFQPFRELWFDYKKEGTHLRFFPIAYQDQALSTHDPLKLSNNHIWWEESPWLDRWLPGNYNSNPAANDFSKGEWNDSLSFSTRDSDGTRLTALRGISLSYEPQETTSFSTTIASPKGLWQDYDSFDNIASATRFKHLFTDNFSLGSTYTFRLGLNEDKANKRDVTDHVMGVDFGYEIIDGLKISAEAAQSFSKKDLTSPGYATKSRGSAYYFSLVGRIPGQSIMDLENDYDEIKPKKDEENFAKFRFFCTRMDEGFEPALSTYRETRDDAYWSRHIQFKRPFEYQYSGLYYPSLRWEDVEPYRIGNGVDIGRQVIGFRMESSLWDERLDNLFDIRNVHKTNDKFVENVARDEVTYKISDKLTTKLLGIYQKMPKTQGGIDPFIFDSDSGEYVLNLAIPDEKDPTLKTGSLGLEYAFFDWLSINGIWERTNDYTMAYDNFPRGNLTSTSFATYTEYDRTYRREDPSLHSQGLFPLPPYPFYNIFKTGLRITPVDKLEIYLDYTRNEFKSAGQIDDNINHIGFEASYMPSKKFGLYFRYTYSRWNDLTRMTKGYSEYYLGHHNFFGEFSYFPSKDDEFVMQYGESGRSNIATKYIDPFNLGTPTLDTRHILRLFYRRKF